MQADTIQGPSRLKQKRARREVLEAHGGGIVGTKGRKDRHGKVCTARGPRDRRVRLSPLTAIQFYDVQDRLGYDRPSKAIDWLMKEAKAAIDALDESSHVANTNPNIFMQSGDHGASELGLHGFYPHPIQLQHENNSSKPTTLSKDYYNHIANGTNCSFFFPGTNGATPSNSTHYLNFSRDDQIRNEYQTQGLCFSFHSSQDFPPYAFAGGQQGSIPLHPHTNTELASGQRLYIGNSNSCNEKEGEESSFNCLPLQFPSAIDENHLFNSHREPLQSSYSAPVLQNLSFASGRFSVDGVLGLSAPSTYHGEEEQSQVSCKPASSPAFLLHYQE